MRQAEAALNTARANLEYAQNNYARMQEAAKTDAVSQIQVLQSKSNVATSLAAVSNAEAALNTARTNLGYVRYVLRSTEQSVATLQMREVI